MNENRSIIVPIKDLLKKLPFLYKTVAIISAYRASPRAIHSYRKSIKKYKDCYQGRRCFIIGNGPSLKAEDLDKLKGEISFAANRIYKMYDKTEWRPTFYCVQDENVMRKMGEADVIAASKESQATWVRMHCFSEIRNMYRSLKNLLFVPIVICGDAGIRFTSRADRYIYDGTTVTYMAMELAAYMGFEKIYLLGVDHSFPYSMDRKGNIIVNDLNQASHFYDSAENNKGEDAWKNRTDCHELQEEAYQAAEDYSRSHGFRIYNATRGGKLEIFERVKLEDLL